MLAHDPELEGVLRVYRNTIGWLRFWSVRFPDEEQRERFAKQLDVRTAGLEELKTKTKMRFRLEVLKELEDV